MQTINPTETAAPRSSNYPLLSSQGSVIKIEDTINTSHLKGFNMWNYKPIWLLGCGGMKIRKAIFKKLSEDISWSHLWLQLPITHQRIIISMIPKIYGQKCTSTICQSPCIYLPLPPENKGFYSYNLRRLPLTSWI